MTMLFKSLGTLEVSAPHASVSRLDLNRSWPHAENQLLLEYTDADGRRVAAQWFADESTLDSEYAAIEALLPGLAFVHTTPAGDPVLLQPFGADAALEQLHGFLQNQHMQLLSHRPGKRAVVRETLNTKSIEDVSYHKFFSSKRTFDRALRNATLIQELETAKIRVPRIIDADVVVRRIHYSSVGHTSLDHLIRRGWNDAAAARVIGRCLRDLHNWPFPDGVETHDARAESKVLADWLGKVCFFFPIRGAQLRTLADAVIHAVEDVQTLRVLLHRDLHDKQLFVAPELAPALIDFDTLACGHPALDVANLLAHLEFRVLQGKTTAAKALTIGEGLIDGYGLDDIAPDLLAFLDATRLRLACVYAFRPRWKEAAERITDRIGLAFGAS